MCQTKHYQEFTRFRMVDTKSIDATMPTNRNLNKDESGKDIEFTKYSGTIDICFNLRLKVPFHVSACLCSKNL